jgi:hypothetical protein
MNDKIAAVLRGIYRILISNRSLRAQFHLFFCACLLFCLIVSLHGQTATATLAGTVRDAAGAVVPNAEIAVRDAATNQTRAATTDANGAYRFNALAVAIYEVCVRAAGFAPYTNERVTLTVNQTTTLDVTLQPVGVSEQVVVTEEPKVLDATQPAATTAIEPARIAELPVLSRNYLEFTLTAPGVAPANPQTSARGGANGFSDSGFTFGGLRPRSNNISIDGLDNTDETTGAARVALSPEIVREFQIINNGLSAEFGGAAGGAINVLTRTGSNDFHGSAFVFAENEIFNARPPLFERAFGARPHFRRYRPGGSLSGRVKRDKLFFYTAIEGENLRAEDAAEIDAATRTRLNSALAGNFAPRFPVRALNAARFAVSGEELEAAGKLTFIASERHTFNLRFAYSNNHAHRNAFNTDALSDLSARGSAFVKDAGLTGSLLSVLTPQLVNDFRFQLAARHVTTRAENSEAPEIFIVGAARFGAPFDSESARRERHTQFVDNISLTHACGELRAGANLNRVALSDEAREGFNGPYVFRSVDDFLNGRAAEWRQAFGSARTRFGATIFGAYLQERLQIGAKLTFDLGARYDLETLPRAFETDKNNFSPRIGVAWNLAKETVMRAGFGLFYDRLPLAYLNRAIQKNGTNAFEQIAFDADAARIFALNGGGVALAPVANIRPSIYRAAANFQTPYSEQAHIGIEHALDADTTARAEYLFVRGVHLPRTRNVNLLPPVLLTSANAAALGFSNPTPQQLNRLVFTTERIDPRYDAVYQLENSAISTYNGLTLALNRRMSREISALVSYTLSRTIDDASDFDEQPANPYDLRAERALSRQDARHRFALSGIFELPFVAEEDEKTSNANKNERNELLREIFGHIEIAPIFSLTSARPVNALTGTDEEHSLAFPFASRPLGFVRNSLRTPRPVQFDLRLVKSIPVREGARLDLTIETFNLLNRRNADAINNFYGEGVAPLSTFGRPIDFAPARQLRFSVDLEF